MRYFIDLKENKNRKHLIHTDYCIESCPSYKTIGHKKSLGKCKNINDALAKAKNTYKEWDNIELCAQEKEKRTAVLEVKDAVDELGCARIMVCIIFVVILLTYCSA